MKFIFVIISALKFTFREGLYLQFFKKFSFQIVFILCFTALAHSSQVIYTIPPADFTPKMTVSGCFCEKDGKMLLLLRNAERTSGNTWSLPAGKILLNEAPITAAIRRLKEETGIRVRQEDLSMFKKFYVRLPDKDFELYLFIARLSSAQEVHLNKEENQDFKWVTLEETAEMRLIPGASIYLKLLANKKP